jgi:hypothetical protein
MRTLPPYVRQDGDLGMQVFAEMGRNSTISSINQYAGVPSAWAGTGMQSTTAPSIYSGQVRKPVHSLADTSIADRS